MPVLAYDTETTGLNLYGGDTAFSFSTATKSGRTAVHRLDGSVLQRKKSLQALRALWQPHNTIVMHNAIFDIRAAETVGVTPPAGHPIHDTQVMSHLLQNLHPTHGLKRLAWELGGYPMDDEAAVKACVKAGGNYSHVPKRIMDVYQRADVERTMLLFRLWWPEVKAKYLEPYKTEIALLWTTHALQKRGVRIHKERAQQLHEKLNVETERILLHINREYGAVNPNSGKHLQHLLYEQLKLPVLGYTKAGQPSTDKETLMELERAHPHPFLDMLMKYRSYRNGCTMLANYLARADADGILHPSIHTTQAATGRESSSNPNLQNVTKSGGMLHRHPVPIRTVFVPKRGYVNYHLDYAGIEMRLLVHYSGDPRMTRAFRNNEDPHILAAKIFYGNATYNSANTADKKRMRNSAKNANYAVHYGAGIHTVATTLGLTAAQATNGLHKYAEQFPGAATLPRKITTQARQYGYVTTVFGRRIHTPPEKPYAAVNYLIQGTGADILKRAQVVVSAYLLQKTGGECGIILPIHDEIVIEVPRKRLREFRYEVLPGVKRRMITFPVFRVPMDVSAKVSTHSWANAVEVHL